VTIHAGFAPDPERAREIDRRMHGELAASLRHILEQGQDTFADERPCLLELIADLDSGAVYPPITFGWYYELVLHLLDDDIERARSALAQLTDTARAPKEQQIVPLDSPDRCQRSRMFRNKLMADMDDSISLEPPGRRTASGFEQRYAMALDLLDRQVPALTGEIGALVREVVPVVGGAEDTGAFEGASHYQLWGALFLNAEPDLNRVTMAERIAHESAHSLLFGFCIDEPLVYNDDNELYPSPLRQDPRPMDGIYHATFVSARMNWTMSCLLESGFLSVTEAEEARAARDNDARNFADGDRVIREHAQLSQLGAELIQGAREWMAESAS